MIAVRLMGGLGNQMFQYAAGKNLAIKHKTGLILDISHYNNQPKEEVPRYFELGCFHISARTTVVPIEQTGFKKLFRKVDPLIIREKTFSFDPNVLKTPNNALLIGYWQSDKYFRDSAMQIKRDFSFKDQLSSAKQRVAQAIKNSENSVSIQIRRGDYVTHKNSSQFHGVLAMDYYERAITAIVRTVKNPVFFVISDDPDWCRKNIKINYPVFFVDHIPGAGHEDMRLTSLCQHNIIANSTFSWWGAWLNQYPKKIVVAPRQWFKDPRTKTPDVVPEKWIRL